MLTGLTLLLIPMQFVLGRAFSYLRFVCLKLHNKYDNTRVCVVVIVTHRNRFKSARLTDQRVKVMNEVITGIRVIKIYAWELAFKRVVANLRR